MYLLFDGVCDDVDIDVDVLDDREEGVAGEDKLSGNLLTFGFDIPHAELPELEGIINAVLCGIASHLNGAEIEVPARRLGEGENEGRTHKTEFNVVCFDDIHFWFGIGAFPLQQFKLPKCLILNLLVDFWEREERVEHLPVLFLVNKQRFPKRHVQVIADLSIFIDDHRLPVYHFK